MHGLGNLFREAPHCSLALTLTRHVLVRFKLEPGGKFVSRHLVAPPPPLRVNELLPLQIGPYISPAVSTPFLSNNEKKRRALFLFSRPIWEVGCHLYHYTTVQEQCARLCCGFSQSLMKCEDCSSNQATTACFRIVSISLSMTSFLLRTRAMLRVRRWIIRDDRTAAEGGTTLLAGAAFAEHGVLRAIAIGSCGNHFWLLARAHPPVLQCVWGWFLKDAPLVIAFAGRSC
jgi:hypothetical protein